MLVIQHDKVDKKVVKRSLAALRRVTPNVLGAVLNAVDVKTTGLLLLLPAEQGQKAEEGEPKGRPPPPVPPRRADASRVLGATLASSWASGRGPRRAPPRPPPAPPSAKLTYVERTVERRRAR